MTRSMTGYGRAQASCDGNEVVVEIRSVNHRYFDCNIRTPRGYTFLEEPLKARLQKSISRGKIDLFVTIDSSNAENVAISLNEPAARAYIDIASALHDKFGIEDDMSATQLMKMQDVLSVTRKEADEEKLAASVMSALEEALRGYVEMSMREGNRLVEDVMLRIANIEILVDKIEVRSPICAEEYRKKLTARLQEVLDTVNIDPQRMMTEVALFADKIAITEEIVRLRSHIMQLLAMLSEEGAVGRKLDFLVQECNREANTIGSKANDVEVARAVVDLKAEIEKIREQIQNIE